VVLPTPPLVATTERVSIRSSLNWVKPVQT
jgi:hypothetical protein